MISDKLLKDISKAQSTTFENIVCQANARGLFLEFGVFEGNSIQTISKNTDNIVYGFDSFEGLPEEWNGLKQGHFATQIPKLEQKNIELVVGYFDKTIPLFVKNHLEPISFIHIDCDLYSSTKTIFDAFKDRFQNDSIIAFDELVKYGDQQWKQHEFKAFVEFLEQTGYGWECIGTYGIHQYAFKINVSGEKLNAQ